MKRLKVAPGLGPSAGPIRKTPGDVPVPKDGSVTIRRVQNGVTVNVWENGPGSKWSSKDYVFNDLNEVKLR